MEQTINYYNLNAKNFIENTQNADMHIPQNRFHRLLAEHASILDFGCGSGRDTKFFLQKGYDVTATDGSAELCKLVSAFSGIDVKEMLFQDLDAISMYNGIWACSSILHLPKIEQFPVFQKMCNALKENSVIYPLKYGNFEGERNGRYFTDFREDTFQEFIKEIPELTVEEQWITSDVRPGRGEEKWLNLILRKGNIC